MIAAYVAGSYIRRLISESIGSNQNGFGEAAGFAKVGAAERSHVPEMWVRLAFFDCVRPLATLRTRWKRRLRGCIKLLL